MSTGKTIQIFLPEGNPRGIRVAEITSRTVKVIQIPRAELAKGLGREELSNVGLYFLVGESESGQAKVYVGETEDCSKRLKDHNRKYDWWQTALVCISTSAAFTKTHVKYLEWHCHQEAVKTGRYAVDNTNVPTKPHTNESMIADLMDHYDTIRLLVSTLGFPFFEPSRRHSRKDVFYCKGKAAKAEGEYNEDGFTVFAGSIAMVEHTKSFHNFLRTLRAQLLADGVLMPNTAQTYKFVKDHVFSSPSTAAAIVLARNANGWMEWKDKDGRTMDEVKRKEG
ncbi:MAG: GIY-YIG nuclease family protein [Flavobacteriales bacterium]|nr:GIY-YIG nuclease family protein [Flavobacteriales bacterium]